MAEFIQNSGLKTIASGGIGDINDVIKLNIKHKEESNFAGVIVGKAIYTRKIKTSELFSMQK
jgi:phosphoribosylformimino-5-aminoimidazole carboxamide ribonucleotide (ProFAR) isomerase